MVKWLDAAVEISSWVIYGHGGGYARSDSGI